MDELNEAGLKLFFKEDIFLIEEKENETSLITEKLDQKPSEVNEPLPASLGLNYKGGNNKGIAIIITDDSNEYLNSRDESLLLNILQAIGLSLEDVAIINQYNSGAEWQEQLEFTKSLVFGILPSKYGIDSENYIIQDVKDVKWLFSDSLFSLASDKTLKGKLWGNLQELF